VSPIVFRQLALEDEVEALRAHAEIAKDDFEFLFDWNSEIAWPDYVKMMDNLAAGINLPPNRVKADLLLAFDTAGELVGRLSVRYAFNDYLREYGGHVGYAVLEKHRRKGYAVEMLLAGVELVRKSGIDDVLVTCFSENVASTGVIKKAGGVFDAARDLNGRTVHRYYIKPN
jgi:predicted acetyltransferase